MGYHVNKMTTEKKWENIFAFAPAEPVKVKSNRCSCGGSNCKTAKGFVCRCSCKHLNHGQEQRRGMEALDKALGLEKESPVSLGDLGLNLELSGRAELEWPFDEK